MSSGYYELKTAKDGQIYFNLKSGNHEIILSSELYTTKAAAENGIASVQTNCSEDGLYDRRESSNGKDYLKLKTIKKLVAVKCMSQSLAWKRVLNL